MKLVLLVLLLCITAISGQSSKVSEERKKEIRKQMHQLRKRNILIYPGTKWCGRGSVAKNFNELGQHRNTDKCCRTHDQCNSTIKAWKTRYNYFNWRPYTVSNCKCDDKLKTCLEAVGSSAAHEVHYLYFDLLGIPCFNLRERKQRICMKRTWYFKCIQYAIVKRKVAELVDQ